MNMTKQEYKKFAEQKAPKSRTARNTTLAFIFGGLICALGQGLLELYKFLGLEQKVATTVVAVTLVVIAATLTAFRVYDDFAKIAKAGSLVPITGFANSMVAPAMEYKAEGHVDGIGAKMFTIAGPVIVYGVVASMVYGVVVWVLDII